MSTPVAVPPSRGLFPLSMIAVRSECDGKPVRVAGLPSLPPPEGVPPACRGSRVRPGGAGKDLVRSRGKGNRERPGQAEQQGRRGRRQGQGPRRRCHRGPRPPGRGTGGPEPKQPQAGGGEVEGRLQGVTLGRTGTFSTAIGSDRDGRTRLAGGQPSG